MTTKNVNYNFTSNVKTEEELLEEISVLKLIITLLVNNLPTDDRALLIKNLQKFPNQITSNYIKNFKIIDE
ncbi:MULTISPECIES: hypothetical protein [Proteus]|uniref:Uncharacterized protein n=1 Tax=Proteus appendicitidis TaxID=3034648 RepID=A0ABY8YBI6_9GAMM|nr:MULTISPECIES: hypothetical protein [Proteus]MCO8051955.1 hypothetical protein [Proteus penneri]WIV89789.1 hypothetical protein QQS39_07220 [Proteus sp. HZ0627]